jgi:caspase domain-containing protein
MFRRLITVVFAAGAVASARADAPTPAPDGVATYALVVGSNAGGPGQAELHFAEEDARRVAAVLTELGGYANVDTVLHPTPEVLRDRIGKLGARVQADQAAGKQTRVFFYYSGHARATAIDLGNDPLPLTELRQRLFAVPATLTIVVLDACQSGAFSRVKGAEPAADFSFNSRQHLDASGVAVLASSSGSELSQESEQLHGSYFTHHLLVGMRGAGDANGDGQVSVDEAYRYAYHQTLLATAATAVGGQHVSLEVDLKGHGEVPLSYPRAATASIELPARLEGQTLVQDKRAKVVVAETYKAKGAAVRIAVAPGDYELLVRQGDHMLRCQVALGGVVELDRCTREAIVRAGTKGPGFERPTRLELSAALGGERHDAYIQTLEDFGFHSDDPFAAGLAVTGLRQIERRLWVGAALGFETSPRYSFPTELKPQRFSWTTMTALAVGRAEQRFAETGFFSRIGAYAQMGAGVAVGRTSFDDPMGESTHDTFVGPAFTLGAGLRSDSPFIHGLGMSAGYELVYTPAITNLTDDRHAGGGHRLTLGISYSY